MKKLFLLICVVSLLVMSCSEEKTIKIGGKDTIVQPYGLFNEETKNDSVVYKISKPDVVLSIVLSETLVVPIVSIGWFLYQPVGKK